MKAYLQAPYFKIPALKTCSGGDSINVTWESYQGTRHIDDVWFLASSTSEAEIFDSDPLGLRTWKGVADPQVKEPVTFNEQQIDVRTNSALQEIVYKVLPTGHTRLVQQVEHYYVTPNAFGLYGNIGVMIQMRCSPTAAWTNLTKKTSDPSTARFEIQVRDRGRSLAAGVQLELQGVTDDAQYAWGGPRMIDF